MPSQTVSLCCWCPSMVLKHLNSNGWFSFYHIIPFVRLRVPPKSGILVIFLCGYDPIKHTMEWMMHAEAPFLCHLHQGKVLHYYRSNGWLCLPSATPVPTLRVDLQIRCFTVIFGNKVWWLWPSMAHEGRVDAFTNCFPLLLMSKHGFETLE